MTTEERQQQYPLGCEVVATAKYREQFPRARPRVGPVIKGRVVGYGRAEGLVRVLIDGHSGPQTFYWHFWDRIV